MGFKANNTIVKGTSKKDVPYTTSIELTEKELEFLLVTIKNGLFKGEYVETCYNTTLKLQEKYKELNNK
tara:strand:+ start:4714 stop:4920 length:207 start_codon:yes stop_codon:yes gene_type:complete